MTGVGSKSELLNVLGDVKASIQDKLGIVEFPMPQFILIGKQSVGKSRLIEALAGETFTFVSGTLGSRRPTVLEFRNVSGPSRWFVRNRTTGQWEDHTREKVMEVIGEAHQELGKTVSSEPVYVRLEAPGCVDLQIVDLPGFREFALDEDGKALQMEIDSLVSGFMADPNNVMLCVEQAGDAATMSTLAKCRQVDPNFQRTILIRNKLDKYYRDLTPETVQNWIEGCGDLPQTLVRFALTLPFWQDGTSCPKPFVELREEKSAEDIRTLGGLGLDPRFLKTIGFKSFATFMEKKIEEMFAAAIQPVLSELKELREKQEARLRGLKDEYAETDQNIILLTTRECGSSLADALGPVMAGHTKENTGRMTLEQELREFHDYHKAAGSDKFTTLPSEDFCGLDDYLEYLRDEAKAGRFGAFDVDLNGGAQFRRMMTEVEIFLRFSEIAVETKKRDVIQARGISMSSLTWRDVVIKLLGNEAHVPLQRRVRYVGERLKWFFIVQKEAIVDFMVGLEHAPYAVNYSSSFPKHGMLIKQNEIIRNLVFKVYDDACDKQLNGFIELFENMLTSTFSNPFLFLKGSTSGGSIDELGVGDDDEKQRIPREIQSRSGIENTLNQWIMDIPEEPHQIDDAVDKVQMLVLKTYSLIRSQVCDQVELFAESFFKVPMLRRLKEEMKEIQLTETDRANYSNRRQRLDSEVKIANDSLSEIKSCIDRLHTFKLNTEAKKGV